jgi:DnaK suppressor protein
MDLDELRADLDQIIREADAALAVAEEEPQETDEDDAIDIDADREEAMLEATAERRVEALAAVARMDAGTYGDCIDCGNKIPEERLSFRPEAARCLSCQERFEQQ